ncbi:hypothetical protein IX51_04995 [uncultured archaeon]|nr:hypothetical protein IX51_04995 [uncultured archaeon]
MLFSSASVVNGHVSKGSVTNPHGAGEWISVKLNSTSSTDIDVTMSENFTVGLVPASELSAVNQSDLSHYSMTPNQTSNTSNTFIISFINDPGQYYIVAFSSSAPSIHYTAIHDAPYTSIFSLLTLFGIMTGIAGLIVVGLGLFVKKKGNA